LDECQTVAVGQPKIEDNRIIGNAFDMPGCVIKARGFVNAETTILESSAHVTPQTLFVLDNKYPHPELPISSPKTTLMERH
jgi:hypothetical protein